MANPTFYKKNELTDVTKIIELTSGRFPYDIATDRDAEKEKLISRNKRAVYTAPIFEEGVTDSGDPPDVGLVGVIAFHGHDPRNKTLFLRDTNIKDLFISFYLEDGFTTKNIFDGRLVVPTGTASIASFVSNTQPKRRVSGDVPLLNYLNNQNENVVLKIPEIVGDYDSFIIYIGSTQDDETPQIKELILCEDLYTPTFSGGGSSVVNTQPESTLLSFETVLQDGSTVIDKLNDSETYNQKVQIQIDRTSELKKIKELSNLSHYSDFVYSANPDELYQFNDRIRIGGSLEETIPLTWSGELVTKRIREIDFNNLVAFDQRIDYDENHAYFFDIRYQPPEVPTFQRITVGLVGYDLDGNQTDLDDVLRSHPIVDDTYIQNDGSEQRWFRIVQGFNPEREGSYINPKDERFKLDPTTVAFDVNIIQVVGLGAQIFTDPPLVASCTIYKFNLLEQPAFSDFDHFGWLNSGDYMKFLGNTSRRVADLDLRVSK